MKKRVIGGVSLFICVSLILIPIIPAAQYEMTTQHIQSIYNEKIDSLDVRINQMFDNIRFPFLLKLGFSFIYCCVLMLIDEFLHQNINCMQDIVGCLKSSTEAYGYMINRTTVHLYDFINIYFNINRPIVDFLLFCISFRLSIILCNVVTTMVVVHSVLDGFLINP